MNGPNWSTSSSLAVAVTMPSSGRPRATELSSSRESSIAISSIRRTDRAQPCHIVGAGDGLLASSSETAKPPRLGSRNGASVWSAPKGVQGLRVAGCRTTWPIIGTTHLYAVPAWAPAAANEDPNVVLIGSRRDHVRTRPPSPRRSGSAMLIIVAVTGRAKIVGKCTNLAI